MQREVGWEGGGERSEGGERECKPKVKERWRWTDSRVSDGCWIWERRERRSRRRGEEVSGDWWTTVVHVARVFLYSTTDWAVGSLPFIDCCYSLLPSFSGSFHPQRPAVDQRPAAKRRWEGGWLTENLDGSKAIERYLESMYRWIEIHVHRYIDGERWMDGCIERWKHSKRERDRDIGRR